MKIITKNRIIDFDSFKTRGDKEYNFNKKCSLCGRPYVKNTLLPDDMINILGDKIKYIPSCNCHIEIFEKNLESINKKTENERIINRGKKYKDFSVIDDRFLNSVFEKGDMENNKNLKLCYRYAEKFITDNVDVGLLLYGTSGTGKTFSSACIGNYLMERGKTVIALNLGLYLSRLKLEWSKMEIEVLNSISQCDLLIIDDFGAEKITDWVLEKVFLLIDTRYRTGKPVIISTNLEYKNDENLCEIQKIFGRRIKDRINEMCFPLLFNGKSRRISPVHKFRSVFSQIY